jgi:transposase
MVERYELHEWQWQLIRDLFPPPKATGRKRRDPRQMLNAVFVDLVQRCLLARVRDSMPASPLRQSSL